MKIVNKWGNHYNSIRHGDRIGQKLLNDLYMHTYKSLTTLLLLSLLFFLFLLGRVPGELLYPWFALEVTINTNRLYDAYRYFHHNSAKSYKQWHKAFVYKSYMTSFIWGSASIIFLPYIEDHELRSVIFLFIAGIGSGAMTSIAPDIRTASVYLFLLMAPLFAYTLYQDNTTNYILAFMIFAFYFLLINVSRNIFETLINNYKQEERYEETQRELYAKQDELNLLFNNAPIAIMYVDTAYNVIDCNLVYTELFGRRREDLVGMNIKDVPDQRPIMAMMRGEYSYSGPYKTITGLELWLEVRFSPILDSDNNTVGSVILIENKSAEKKAIEELRYIARHDDLTKLSNRRSFMEYMKTLVKKKSHQNHFSILFYLDLNQFKTINDTMGHSVGDQLLTEVAKRLQDFVKDGDRLSRLGGDEFAILFPFVATDVDEARKRADKYSKRLGKIFDEVFLIEGIHMYIKSSIGIVIIEPRLYDIEEIIRYADIAMYSAKRKGIDTVAYYNAELDIERKDLFKLQHDLYKAIENHQFELHYQPIVNIKDESITAAEALVRWYHPKLGLLSSGAFVPLAIESGLIDKIGWLVIGIVCREISQLKKRGLFLLDYISININATQLHRIDFVDRFLEKIDRYAIYPSEIRLEITETSLIDNYEQSKDIIDRLRSRGVYCAIDDFGTGYSSLSYLKKFSFSILKIDKEFIKDILENSDDIFLVESIISIGKKLGYTIIIEGIETEEQKDLLMKIDETLRYQGYLYSPPLTFLQFAKKLQLESKNNTAVKL